MSLENPSNINLSSPLVTCTVVIRAKKKFDFQTVVSNYTNTRFSLYQNTQKKWILKVAFNDKNSTKETLFQDLSTDKNVISFQFYKTWKEVENIFQEDDTFSLVHEKKLQVGFALKSNTKSRKASKKKKI